ncbi:hypothetical protein QWJ34_26925 [Saccharibacillus sp. CPCC 101409]|uniref:hypothetical protein n=1 Tax=Saccharibacillus sp. CPCC 101409 TaxID=3058041 RepID=UPI00267394A1|nr:hypothetical protein [Saccharibacillus sp. CPCC 101409]MDO3413412.1 hypothetical protein [Saccharibacillus sp. CPCC 101409]
MNVLLEFIIALTPSTVLLLILFQVFPYTGLGRIITTPVTYALNVGVISLGLLAMHLLHYRYLTAIWVIVIIVTLVITVWKYPQEFKPHIVQQVWDKIRNR